MKEFKHTRLDNRQFTEDDIKGFIKDYNIKFIKLQFVDINGQVKNMTIPSQHIEKALNNEIMLDGSSEALKRLICSFIPTKTRSKSYPGADRTESIPQD